MQKNSKSHMAFTLAEVLITLGIIGVVAAITMPTLIANYQKQVTVNRLKQTYTILYQAIRLSEADNGSAKEWEILTDTNEWIKKYIAPYLKHTSIIDSTIKLANGVAISFWRSGNSTRQIHVYIYLNDMANAKNGKDYFIYFLGKESNYGKNEELRPYDAGIGDAVFPSRINLIKSGCNKDSKNYCAALIMFDGWKISKDYPW